MKNKKQKTAPIIKDSYLQAIRNSTGVRLFRNFYATVDGNKKDILRDGDLSCAYFVSCVLRIFDLIGKIHLTVEGTVTDMKKSGWKIVKVPKKGSVLVWEKQKFGPEEHGHIGFYIGNKKARLRRGFGGQAISNSSVKQNVKRAPVEHSFTFGGKRRIEAIYWHKKLN